MSFSLGGSLIGGGLGFLAGGPMGAGLGALSGSGILGGDNPQQTTTSTVNPYVAPYLNDYLNSAKNIGTNADYQLGSNMARSNATGGNPYLNAANQTLTDTASGKYLDPASNPYLQGTIDKSLGDVRSMAGSTFSGLGFGGSAHEEWLNRKGNEAIAPILMNNYQQERGNQLNASSNANNFANAGANSLMDLGTRPLNVMGSAIGNASGGGSNTTGANPNYRNPMADTLGLLSAGAGAYQMFNRPNNSMSSNGMNLSGVNGY